MSINAIVQGCTWDGGTTVRPDPGQQVSDVVADLTGASVVAELYDATGVLLVALDVSIDPPTRLISFGLTRVVTALLPIRGQCVIDVRVTTSDGRVLAIDVGDRVRVQRFTSG